MPKIYVELRSGLGNQLFQFAFAYALCKGSGRELVISPVYFDSFFKYWIKRFLQREPRKLRLPLLLSSRQAISFEPLASLEKKGVRVLRENEHSIEEIIAQTRLPGDIYLKGYWQDPGLFTNLRQELMKDIHPTFQLSSSYHRMVKSLDQSSVAIHVRRGDFLSNKAFGACTLDYYIKAIGHIAATVKNPRFTVFTNDKSWVDAHLSKVIEYNIYSNAGNVNTDIEEMYLMTKFTSLIIPNSTFSWWSAYLNNVDNGNIVAPSRWFLSKDLQGRADSLLDTSWMIIDNELTLTSK